MLRVLEGLLSLVTLALGLLTLLLPLLTRRLRTFGYVLAASFVVSLLMTGFDSWLGLTGAINEAAVAAGRLSRDGAVIDADGAVEVGGRHRRAFGVAGILHAAARCAALGGTRSPRSPGTRTT